MEDLLTTMKAIITRTMIINSTTAFNKTLIMDSLAIPIRITVSINSNKDQRESSNLLFLWMN